jgi:hypothetical protein
MNLTSLRWLTWGTIAGSVASALLLAAGDSGPLPRGPHQAPPQVLRAEDEAARPALPREPTRAGFAAKPAPASGASR